MEQISPNNATETELYNSLTNSCSHSAGMKNNGTSEDKARDQLLSYEIQNKMMLQHNEPYIIVDMAPFAGLKLTENTVPAECL